jgi:hypothetical protein
VRGFAKKFDMYEETEELGMTPEEVADLKIKKRAGAHKGSRSNTHVGDDERVKSGWDPKEENETVIYMYMYVYMHVYVYLDMCECKYV